MLPFILITFIVIALIVISLKIVAHNKNHAIFIGGVVHTMSIPSNLQVDMDTDFTLSRFVRPSAQPALQNKYSFTEFEKQISKTPLVLNKFQSSEDVILAFFGILQDASNMVGYSELVKYPISIRICTFNRRESKEYAA